MPQLELDVAEKCLLLWAAQLRWQVVDSRSCCGLIRFLLCFATHKSSFASSSSHASSWKSKVESPTKATAVGETNPGIVSELSKSVHYKQTL